jgi:sialic acid synthase SpsE
MRIADFELEGRVMVVAEVGNNHEGSLTRAHDLVTAAADAGVHAVKFQTYRTSLFANARDRVRYDRLSKFELSFADFEQLHRHAKSLGLLFISTPLDLESALFLENLVDAYKIASGDINFYPLIEQVCQTGKPIIFSTGGSDVEQIRSTRDFIRSTWSAAAVKQEMALLHCVSSYPAPLEEANLTAIPFLQAEVGGIVGYSDHTIGIEACLAAAALGAQIIEKHFTLDKLQSDFRDHHLSADPHDMKLIVQAIDRIRKMMGRGGKHVQPSEAAHVDGMRRSIVAARDLPAGHEMARGDLMWVRPSGGLPPGEEHRLIGRRLCRSVSLGEQVQAADVR